MSDDELARRLDRIEDELHQLEARLARLQILVERIAVSMGMSPHE